MLAGHQQLREKRVHKELVHIRHVAHEVDSDFIFVRAAPYVGKSHDFSVAFQHCNVKTFHIFFIEISEREPFLAARLEIQPGIRNLLQAWDERRHISCRNDFKRQSILVDLSVGIAERLATRSFQREFGEINAGDFTEFQGDKAHIQKQGQALRTNTVKYGAQGKLVGQPVKGPCKLFAGLFITDGFAKRDQTAPGLGIHDEGAVVGGQKKLLVAKQRQGGIRVRPLGDEGGHGGGY